MHRRQSARLGGWQKFFKNGSITGTSKSQNKSITKTQICPKRPFPRIFRDAFGPAPDFDLFFTFIAFCPIFTKMVAWQRPRNRKMVVCHPLFGVTPNRAQNLMLYKSLSPPVILMLRSFYIESNDISGVTGKIRSSRKMPKMIYRIFTILRTPIFQNFLVKDSGYLNNSNFLGRFCHWKLVIF